MSKEFELAQRYVPKLYQLLRAEDGETAFKVVRELQEIEEEADKLGLTVVINASMEKDESVCL